MKREFTLKLDDIEYPVVAEGEAVNVNGRPFTVEITEDGEVLVDGIAYEVELEGEKATVGEQSYAVLTSGLVLAGAAAAAPGAAPAPEVAEGGAGAVLAIMPGKIIHVLVESGQQVEEGQPVCVLEAMKMENELNAPCCGTVGALHVSPGDDVEKDQVLIEIEAE